MAQETQDLLRRAIDSLMSDGYAKITQEEIHIPVHGAASSTLPIKYVFDTIQESPSDYLPEYDGVCMIGIIRVVNKTFALNIAFKQTNDEMHPYKILLD